MPLSRVGVSPFRANCQFLISLKRHADSILLEIKPSLYRKLASPDEQFGIVRLFVVVVLEVIGPNKIKSKMRIHGGQPAIVVVVAIAAARSRVEE